MDDRPRVTPPSGTGRDDDDEDGPAAARPAAAGEGPADGPAADEPAAGDTGRPHKSTRPEGYEPL